MSQTFLSRRKIAARGGFSPSTLKNYAEQGVGPAFIRLPTGACRYSIVAFDVWLAKHQQGGEQ
ncbi:helix-turn-helix transcriptional regulator [Tardiphaga sp. 11_C7_N12_6]|uniref:helix-turn-helix transcriptional regulator n=1 Tax=Tardiphaga sp. 11_C7_N12_6 TaxID=3240789 RepID=UPI003F1E7A97